MKPKFAHIIYDGRSFTASLVPQDNYQSSTLGLNAIGKGKLKHCEYNDFDSIIFHATTDGLKTGDTFTGTCYNGKDYFILFLGRKLKFINHGTEFTYYVLDEDWANYYTICERNFKRFINEFDQNPNLFIGEKIKKS